MIFSLRTDLSICPLVVLTSPPDGATVSWINFSGGIIGVKNFGHHTTIDSCIFSDSSASTMSDYGIINYGDSLMVRSSIFRPLGWDATAILNFGDYLYVLTDTFQTMLQGVNVLSGDKASIYDCYFRNCTQRAMHMDGPNGSIEKVRVLGSSTGIPSHGSSNSVDIRKALISNCDIACHFSDSTSIKIDRTTIFNVDDRGIYNQASPTDNVIVSRTLCYHTLSGPVPTYHFYENVTFDDVWSADTNDNVAIGADTYSDTLCAGLGNFSNFFSLPSGGFTAATADLVVDADYSSSEWGLLSDDHAAKMLCHYVLSSGGSYDWEDCVGYDTTNTTGVARSFWTPNAHRTPGKELVWQPNFSVTSGIYFIKARSDDGRTGNSKLVYMK